VEIDQEKSAKPVKSVVEIAYFRVESIFARLQNGAEFESENRRKWVNGRWDERKLDGVGK